MHVLILLPHTIMKDVLKEKKAIVNQHIIIFSINTDNFFQWNTSFRCHEGGVNNNKSL